MPFSHQILSTFLAVAEAGSIGRAAQILNSTQPTTSRKIQRLEEMLGASLFDRLTTGLTLTDVGRELLPRAKALLHEMQLAQDAIDAHRGLRRGSVRLGGGEALVRGFLPSLLARIAAHSPELTIKVLVASEDVLERALAQHDVDIVFSTAQPVDVPTEPLGSGVVYSDVCVVFCRPDHPVLSHRAHLECALKYPWAMPGPHATPHQQFTRLLGALGHRMPKIGLETESVDLMISVAASSDILGWLPLPLLEPALASHEVQLPEIPELEMRRDFFAFRRSYGTFPHPARLFARALT